MQYYPAFFLPAIEGGYLVRFPDIPEAFTEGYDLQSSLDMAHDVLALCLEEYISANRAVPEPSTPYSLDIKLAEQMKEPGVDARQRPLIQMIPAPDMDTRIIKLNIVDGEKSDFAV